jgi:hypothetical protein
MNNSAKQVTPSLMMTDEGNCEELLTRFAVAVIDSKGTALGRKS